MYCPPSAPTMSGPSVQVCVASAARGGGVILVRLAPLDRICRRAPVRPVPVDLDPAEPRAGNQSEPSGRRWTIGRLERHRDGHGCGWSQLAFRVLGSEGVDELVFVPGAFVGDDADVGESGQGGPVRIVEEQAGRVCSSSPFPLQLPAGDGASSRWQVPFQLYPSFGDRCGPEVLRRAGQG